jgi:threonine aldolase
MTARLKTDHENAKLLAEMLSKIDGIYVDLNRTQTNIVTFNLTSPTIDDSTFLRELKENGVLALTQGKNKVRLVTHNGIEKEHIEKTVAAIEKILTKPQPS